MRLTAHTCSAPAVAMTVVGIGVESSLRNGTGSVEGCGREACIGAGGGPGSCA